MGWTVAEDSPHVAPSFGTHSELFAATNTDDRAGHHAQARGPARAVGTLLAASAAAAWMSEVLVGAAEATGHALGMSPIFRGMVLLAVIGGRSRERLGHRHGAAEQAGHRRRDRDGQLDPDALFVTPMLVLLSGLVGPTTLGLAFNRLEIGVLLIATLMVVTTSNDGRATWFKGVQPLAVCLVIAASVYWLPVAAP